MQMDGRRANNASTRRGANVALVKSLLESVSARVMLRNSAQASRDSILNLDEFKKAVLAAREALKSNAVITVLLSGHGHWSRFPIITLHLSSISSEVILDMLQK